MAFAIVACLSFVAPAAAENNGPVFYPGTVTPTSMDFNGGQFTVTAQAIDDYGIFMFYADVHGPGGYGESVQMFPSSIPDDPNQPWTFTGIGTIPPNYTADPVTWNISATVTDDSGQTAGGPIGDIYVEGQPNFDEFPVAYDPYVTPRDVPERAGNVTIGVSATDDRNVASATAFVKMPDGSETPIDLTPTDYTKFSGVFDVPDNTTPNALVHRVRIVVTDDIGQSVEVDAGTFTVAAAPTQPAGLLALSPTWSLLGPTAPGRKSRATFTVRNNGKPNSPTLTSYAAISGATFSIVGAPGTEQTLAIRAGQTAKVVVEFAPTRRGTFNGKLTVRRQDGKQRALSATLLGLSY